VYSILLEGYSVKFKVLRCEEYGVASIRKRLILLAAEPGRSLPEWPAPTHNSDMVPFVTLGQAIERFPLNSLTCRLGKHGVLPHHGDVENHCTGCSEAKLETWDENTIPSLDEPICSE
jgi:site-specific DNA-cytosine methylase